MSRRVVQLFPVLVIEDDANTREAMKSVLELHGYPVVTAADGNEALQRLRTGLKPCLSLLDLMMPGMDGFEFFDEKRQDPRISAIPVVIYSGHHDAKSNAARLGAEGYFQKPVDVQSLLSLVETYRAPRPASTR
jgi:chemotaxis family two-component system sensor histidine kinase/response regulator PixL